MICRGSVSFLKRLLERVLALLGIEAIELFVPNVDLVEHVVQTATVFIGVVVLFGRGVVLDEAKEGVDSQSVVVSFVEAFIESFGALICLSEERPLAGTLVEVEGSNRSLRVIRNG